MHNFITTHKIELMHAIHVGGQPTDTGTISSPDGIIKFEVIAFFTESILY